MSLVYVFLIPLFIPGLVALVLFFLKRKQGAGFWRALAYAASVTKVVGSALTFVLLTMISFFGSKSTLGANWVGLFIIGFVYLFFWALSSWAKNIATITNSRDIDSVEEMKTLRAKADTVFYSDEKFVAAGNLRKLSFGEKIEQFVQESERVTGRPINTHADRIDFAMDTAEISHDVSEAAFGDGDTSPGTRIVFLLAAAYAILFLFIGDLALGRAPGGAFYIQIIMCIVGGFIFGEMTWRYLPSRVRIGARVAMFFWPVTLIVGFYIGRLIGAW